MSALTGYVSSHSFGDSISIWCEAQKRRYQAYDLEPDQFPILSDVSFELTADGRLAVNVSKREAAEGNSGSSAAEAAPAQRVAMPARFP